MRGDIKTKIGLILMQELKLLQRTGFHYEKQKEEEIDEFYLEAYDAWRTDVTIQISQDSLNRVTDRIIKELNNECKN
jgi:thymidylate kinase